MLDVEEATATPQKLSKEEDIPAPTRVFEVENVGTGMGSMKEEVVVEVEDKGQVRHLRHA